MVITVEIENYAVKKVLVDEGTSVDILYWVTYQKIQLPNTAMVPYDEPIYGFFGEKVSTRGYIASIPSSMTEPKPRPFLSASSSSMCLHPIMSS